MYTFTYFLLHPDVTSAYAVENKVCILRGRGDEFLKSAISFFLKKTYIYIDILHLLQDELRLLVICITIVYRPAREYYFYIFERIF